MKIKTKVKAGRGCGGTSTPDIQSDHTAQRPHIPGTPATVRPFPNQETIMKIKTKVKAGRGCGGSIPTPDIQSDHTTQRPHIPGTPATVRPFPSQETIMKIKTKVKAGPRDCGGGSGPTPISTDVQSDVHPAHLGAPPRHEE